MNFESSENSKQTELLWSYNSLMHKNQQTSRNPETSFNKYEQNEKGLKHILSHIAPKDDRVIYRQIIEKTAQEKAKEWFDEFIKDNFASKTKTNKGKHSLSKKNRSKVLTLDLDRGSILSVDPNIETKIASELNFIKYLSKAPSTSNKAQQHIVENCSQDEDNAIEEDASRLLYLVQPKKMSFSNTNLNQNIIKMGKNKEDAENASLSSINSFGIMNALRNQRESGSTVLEDYSYDSKESLTEKDELQNQLREKELKREKELAAQELKAEVLAKEQRLLQKLKDPDTTGNDITDSESSIKQLSKSCSSYEIDSKQEQRLKINTAVKKSPKTLPMPHPKIRQKQHEISRKRHSVSHHRHKTNKNLKQNYETYVASFKENNSNYDAQSRHVTFNEQGHQEILPKVGRLSSKTQLTNPQINFYLNSHHTTTNNTANLASNSNSTAASKKPTQFPKMAKKKIVVKDMHRKDDMSYIDDSYDTFYYKHYKPEMRRTIIVCKYRRFPKSRKAKATPLPTINDNQNPQGPTNENEKSKLLKNSASELNNTSKENNSNNSINTNKNDNGDINENDSNGNNNSDTKVKSSNSKKKIFKSRPKKKKIKRNINKSMSKTYASSANEVASDTSNFSNINEPAHTSKDSLQEKRERLNQIINDIGSSNAKLSRNYSLYKPIDYSQCELSSLIEQPQTTNTKNTHLQKSILSIPNEKSSNSDTSKKHVTIQREVTVIKSLDNLEYKEEESGEHSESADSKKRSLKVYSKKQPPIKHIKVKINKKNKKNKKMSKTNEKNSKPKKLRKSKQRR